MTQVPAIEARTLTDEVSSRLQNIADALSAAWYKKNTRAMGRARTDFGLLKILREKRPEWFALADQRLLARQIERSGTFGAPYNLSLETVLGSGSIGRAFDIGGDGRMVEDVVEDVQKVIAALHMIKMETIEAATDEFRRKIATI